MALARRGDQAATGTLREMLSTADLNKVIDLTGDTEKQNKIEAIELEALEALRTSISAPVKPSSPSRSRPQITELTKSGLVSVRSQALELLQSLQTNALTYTSGQTSVGAFAGHACDGSGELHLVGSLSQIGWNWPAAILVAGAVTRPFSAAHGLLREAFASRGRRSTRRYRHKSDLELQ